ncbi:probable phosphoglycerate mutase [Propionibacterium cyclohexanicum]|uniref:Probable phosphoglycerate mutase n=1 Tax=Propionibacterium cyclohexanicum TaxID=64702 RepID=A0A1H9SA52_9ACTN|nr:histidine phosphatase family protein [Propionibacterium cyclohexanicum]SER81926.1 probable phosphoglycerate mutase [Propionibacterium cyclohexanicum]
MSAPTRLVLWRHGQTDWNLASRFQGQTDVPLNFTGINQAREAAPKVAALHPDAIVSSPLQRTTTTADALAELTGLAVATDERLMEIDVGSWAGRTFADIAAEGGIDPRDSSLVDRRYSPTGETRTEVGRRVGAALREIASAHPGQTVVIVSHGVSIRMGAAALCGLSYAQAHERGSIKNCSWTILEPRQGRWRIVAWNLSAFEDGPDTDY